MVKGAAIAIVLLFLILAPPVISQAPFSPGDTVRTLQSGGLTRTYRLHVPRGYDAKTPMPLVLTFHGYALSARIVESYTGMLPVSPRAERWCCSSAAQSPT